MKLYVVRHGQTNYNLKRLCNDDPSKNVYLTEVGKKGAKEVAGILKSRDLDLIFISEFSRIKETADIINRFHNAPMKIDKRLNDRKVGIFDSKTTFEFHKFLEKDIFNIAPPNGESFQDEKKRVFSFIEDLKKLSYSSVLIVTHHEIVKIIKGYFNKLSDNEMWNTFVKNCEFLEFNL